MQAMQQAPVLPRSFQIELERRPRSARKLGYVIPPPQKTQLPPVVVEEADLHFRETEVSRRPAAAKRLGFVEVAVDSLDADTISVSKMSIASLAAGKEEIRRRPHAADHLGIGLPKLPTVVSAPAMPLHKTWTYVEEANRQPQAARRQGLVALNQPLGDRLPSPLPFGRTASASLEAQRRPRSVARLYPDRPRLAPQHIPDLPLREMACFKEEAARRPRSVARLAAMETARSAEAESEVEGPASVWPSAHPELRDGNLQYVDIKQDAAAAASAERPNPFTALERMLEERLTAQQQAEAASGYSLGAMGEGRVRGGTTRGSSRGGSRHGPGSRGGSLRDGAGYNSATASKGSYGSFSNLQRCGSQTDVRKAPVAAKAAAVGAGSNSAAAAPPGPIGVHCGLEEGMVVCRDESNNVVLLTCSADDTTGALNCVTTDNTKFKA